MYFYYAAEFTEKNSGKFSTMLKSVIYPDNATCNSSFVSSVFFEAFSNMLVFGFIKNDGICTQR